jgi:hypothetical protein
MLKNKKILFLTPEFYSYPEVIKNSLVLNGAEVDLFYNRPTNLAGKFSEFFLTKKYENVKNNFFLFFIQKTQSHYDYILIIRADLIPGSHLKRLKDKFASSIFIQYIWDDIHLFPKILDTFPYFDRLFSYDINESREYGLSFRPFFFTRFRNSNRSSAFSENEIFFIGAYNRDRLEIIEKVRELNPQINFHFHFYINPLAFVLAKLPVRYLRFFKFRKMKYSHMLEEIENSVAVLDIQNISQCGLTTRVFEALGAGVKIITVNDSIRKYDFYNDDNILIIDRKRPEIEKLWIDIPFRQYEENTLKKYHIEEWIKEVFGIQ